MSKPAILMPQSPPSETLTISTCKHSFPSELSLKEDGEPKNPQESATVTIVYPIELFGLCKQIVAELLGTYILVFVGCVADIVCRETLFTIAIVWGLVWMVLVYALGLISGAHINPAVAIALVVAHRFPFTQVPMYVLAQLIGATLACLNLRVLFHHQQDMMSTLIQYPSSTTVLQAIVWEYTITFILMLTISGVATDRRVHKELSEVAIGATVMFSIVIAGLISGASMNPARSIGPAIVCGVYKNVWVYVVGPILGATTTTLTYSVPRVPDAEKTKESIKIKDSPYLDTDLYFDVNELCKLTKPSRIVYRKCVSF